MSLSKTASTSTNTRISRMLRNRSTTKDTNQLSPRNTRAQASSSFKSENNLTIPDINHPGDKRPNGLNETQTPFKVN